MAIIKLVNGGETTIDKEFEYLSKYRWYKSKEGYAIFGGRRDGIKSFAKLHRIVTNAQKGQVVDHINHDKLDNRLCNLRITDNFGNAQNMPKWGNNKYKGVNYVKKLGLYQSRCRANGVDKFLGYFNNEIAAAYAYNKYITGISSVCATNDLPYTESELDKMLITCRTKKKPARLQSRFRYVFFKKKKRGKKDWYVRNKDSTKGYFATDIEAYRYILDNHPEWYEGQPVFKSHPQ